MVQTYLNRFNKLISIVRKMSALCGADFLKEGYKISFLTCFTVFAINVFICFTFYTMYFGLAVEGDWTKIPQSMCTLGSALQGYSKLLSAIIGRAIGRKLVEKLNNIYKEGQNDQDLSPFLHKRIDITTKMMKIVMYMYVAACTTIIVYTLIYGMTIGEKLLILPFVLPGVDPATNIGYTTYVVYHSVCIAIGAFGNFAGDMFIFITITHIPLLTDVFRVKCLKLNRLVETAKKPKKSMAMLKDILQWHQQYNTYLEQAEMVYYYIIFVQVTTSIMGICCTLFCIILKVWPAAVIYLIYSYIILIAYCGLGNLVEISNDDIVEIIYGDILWYELSVKEQKLVLLMLRKSQNPTTLTVCNIMPLSMGTALQLSKAIYSYLMVLMNFLEDSGL